MVRFLLACSAAFFAGANALHGRVLDVNANMGTDRVLHIPFSSLNEPTYNLLSSFDVDEFGNTGDGLDVKVPEDAVTALTNAEVVFEDTTEAWIQEFENNLADPNFVCTAADCGAAKEEQDTFYDSYQRYTAIHDRIDSIAIQNSNLVTVGSIGTSHEGRDLKVIEIEKIEQGAPEKPTVLYICGVHAREWLPPMYCTHMAETLVQGAGHPLLNSVRFAIIPVMNPDGYEFSQTVNNMWRKSRKPNPGSSCIGTDLNRNYDDHHCGQGASTNRCSDTYCGTSPFDNVETLALKQFGESINAREGGSILHFVDVHAYGQYWMSPYGWTTNLPPAQDYSRMEKCMEAAATAIQQTNGLRFTTGSSANAIYVAAGGSDDWFYSALDVVYANTAEVRGSSFQPNPSNIKPSNEEIFNAMVANVNCALEGGNPPEGPNDNECEDMNPNGISYSDGRPAACSDLSVYCSSTRYTFVRERCPKTCNACESFVEIKSSELTPKSVQRLDDISEFTGSIPFILGLVGVGAVAGVATAYLVIRRQRKKLMVENTSNTFSGTELPTKLAVFRQGANRKSAPASSLKGTVNPMNKYDV